MPHRSRLLIHNLAYLHAHAEIPKKEGAGSS